MNSGIRRVYFDNNRVFIVRALCEYVNENQVGDVQSGPLSEVSGRKSVGDIEVGSE